MSTISLVLISLMTLVAAVGLIITGLNWADADQVNRSIVGQYDPEDRKSVV